MKFQHSRLKIPGILMLLAFLLASPAWAQLAPDSPSSPDYIGNQIRAALAVTEAEIDYTELTLTFTKLVDPKINEEAIKAELDRMVEDILELAGSNPTDAEKLSALRQYIYDAGPWNDNRVFAYDQSDPLGTHLPNKLIHNYLQSRLGNCVSMPTLFLILGDRIGLNLTLSTAPNHVFVHYHLPDGRVVNIETTSGGHPSRNEWIRQNFKMTDAAVANGLYLKTMSRRQTGALLASIVLENYYEQQMYGYVVHIADALLEVYPEYDAALILRGMSYQSMLQINFLDKYPDLRMVPQSDVPFFNHLAQNAENSFNRVETLGYVQPE